MKAFKRFSALLLRQKNKVALPQSSVQLQTSDCHAAGAGLKVVNMFCGFSSGVFVVSVSCCDLTLNSTECTKRFQA